MYEYDMDGEGRSILMEEGWHYFTINNMVEETSKQGNEMFVVSLYCPINESVDTVYMVTAKGKRWLLKSLLKACGIPRDEKGVYKFESNDLIGLAVEGRNQPEPNEYINREGETIKEMRNRIVDFRETKETTPF